MQSRIGINTVSDIKSGIYFPLPAGLLIYNNNGRVWVGGSKENDYYLHIERIPAGEGEIPTILAEGDLDLFRASVGKSEKLNDRTKAVNVAGTYSSRSIAGTLARTRKGSNHYLVLVATPTPQKEKNCRSMVEEIVENIGRSFSIAA